MHYYNDHDKTCCRWLKELIARGLLPLGDVDDRSITDVKGSELDGYEQCHFFAGIGGWPLALESVRGFRLVGAWSGSCPCQPFSSAGKRRGVEDERHLWPEFARLIDERKPPVVFGEQVASKAGRDWLATVRTDLEAMGYVVGAADLCAAGVGAPHIRQRLYWGAWLADSHGAELLREPSAGQQSLHERSEGPSGLAHTGRAYGNRQQDTQGFGCDTQAFWKQDPGHAQSRSCDGGLANTESERGSGWSADSSEQTRIACAQDYGGVGNADRIRQGSLGGVQEEHGANTQGSPWSDAEYILCRDGKSRPVKPGILLLAHGLPNRVGRLKGFGNAIVPKVATEFVSAFTEAIACPDVCG